MPLGADHEFFRPGVDTREVRERYGLGGGRWLLSVARLTRHKGIDTALQALARLASRYPDLRYAVVGKRRGAARRSSGEARELGVADRVALPHRRARSATCPRSTTAPRSTSACRG